MHSYHKPRKDKYYCLETPLDLAVEMIAEYYDKMSTSDAFILSMCALLLFLILLSDCSFSLVFHLKMKMHYFT